MPPNLTSAGIFYQGVAHLKKLPTSVRDANYGKTVCFSLNTGRYIIYPDIPALEQFIASLEEGDLVWRSRIS